MNYPFAVELKSAADYLTMTAPLLFQDDQEAIDISNRLAAKLHDLAIIEAGDKVTVLYHDILSNEDKHDGDSLFNGADRFSGSD